MVDKVIERIRLENLIEGLSKEEVKEEVKDIYSLITSFNSFLKTDKVSFETNALLVFLFKNGYIQTKGEK